jgi:hypothetical protein
MPIYALPPQAPNQVVEGRLYGVWRDQEYINKCYFRLINDTGAGTITNQTLALALQTAWRANMAVLVPTDFTLRQYWCGTIHSVVRIPGPPVRWLVSYVDQTVVLGDTADIGTHAASTWLPPTDAVTMNRFGEVRNKNWRSSIRLGPIDEEDQTVGLLFTPAVAVYNAALAAMFTNPFTPAGVNDVIALNCLFSPALAVGLTQLTMDGAAQNIFEWRASRLVGTQRTRKIRSAGY